MEGRKGFNNVTNYWYCYVYGSDGPKVRHTSYEAAEQEAKRITEKWGKKVEILKLVAISQVKASIKSFEIPLSSVDKKVEEMVKNNTGIPDYDEFNKALREGK